MPVTMKDIAAKAGITRSAVSAVLNGTIGSRVSAKTREHVLNISRELNYRPNFIANALKNQRTGLLGLICGGLQSPFFSELTMSMTEAAEKHGYRLMLALMPWGNKLDMKYLDQMLTNMCDGVFMHRELNIEKDILQQRIKAENIPFVILDSELSEVSSVAFDYRIGMEKAFDELLANGHHRIAFAGHSCDVHKLDAYRECCHHHRIEPVEYCFEFDHNYHDVITCGMRIAQFKERQSALISTDFGMSMMIQGMDAAGLRIPNDLSVIAFNDTMQSRFFRPPLTSVALNTRTMACYGMNVMLDLIKNRDPAKVKIVLIPPELIRRDSVCRLT